MNKIINNIKEVYASRLVTDEEINNDIHSKVILCLILAAASLILTIMNVVKGLNTMAIVTGVLVVGFLMCSVMCGSFKLRKTAMVLMGLLVAVIFGYFAISGQNDGFACLWLILIPPVGMNFLNIQIGSILSFLFQIFLIVIFWCDPFRRYFVENGIYTMTFLMRFPVLYLTTFLAALVLSIQKQHYVIETRKLAYIDILTELGNRRYYELIKNDIIKSKDLTDLTIISIDINCLKRTNDTLGHKAGDELIIGVARCIQKAFSGADCLSRTGGDEFMVITHVNQVEVDQQVATFGTLVDTYEGIYIKKMSASLGRASHSMYPGFTIFELEKKADERMYDDKDEFYSKFDPSYRRK